MRYDELGLNSLIVSHQDYIPGLGRVWIPPPPGLQAMPLIVGQVLQEQGVVTPQAGTFLRVAASAAGLIVFLLLGTGVAVAVALLKGPLWGVATAALLGGGFYLYRDFELTEYQRTLALNA